MHEDLSYVLGGGGVVGGSRDHSPRFGQLCDLGQVTWPLWASAPSLRCRSRVYTDAVPVSVVRMVSSDAKGVSCSRKVCSPRGAGMSGGIMAKAGGVVPGAFSRLKKVESRTQLSTHARKTIPESERSFGEPNLTTLKITLEVFCLYSLTQAEVENIYLCCFTRDGLWPDETDFGPQNSEDKGRKGTPSGVFIVSDYSGETRMATVVLFCLVLQLKKKL